MTTVSPAQAAEFHGRWINGRILEAYNRLGGHRAIGDATTDELNAGRDGKFQVFDKTLNSIYWHPMVDNGVAHQVKGRIRDKWRDFGWENGRLKYPTTDEITPPDGTGRFSHFEGGSIYWHPQTGPAEIEGRIRDRWQEVGWETGTLGYPTTDEMTPPDGIGKFNHFQNGSIYWTPDTCAQIVKGRIRDYWSSRGWEAGPHGYPIGEEYNVEGGVQQNFQNLNIQWVPSISQQLPTGDHTVWDGYQLQYPVIAQDDRWTPNSVNREVTEHFDAYFTFTGCGQKLRVGDRCDLKTVIDTIAGPAPIEVTSISNDVFSFKSLEGHPEGAGRTITFRFVSKPGDFDVSKKNVHLIVTAWGPTSKASLAGPFNSQSLARYSWGKFSRNLNERINNAGTDYLTEDKYVDSARSRSMSTVPNDDIGLDSPVVKLPDEELDWVSTSVPLVPLDGTPAPEEVPQHVVQEVLSEQKNSIQ
ncbi:LGFP repeat-containing protein [Corynebacterium provencense]|uniref:LGFP repeat-containing protein n=1 Tax=Corynebacterium provencense TaxID=1737425 RepID=UPI0009900EF2|nr:hypothetical protein [Corynebacterium provencense]